MKFVKRISLFFILPLMIFGIGIFAGAWSIWFFYPGSLTERGQEEQGESVKWREEVIQKLESEKVDWDEDTVENGVKDNAEDDAATLEKGYAVETSSSGETLFVDTEYVLEETDIIHHSVVETVWKLPAKYVGMNREQFLEAMESYEAYPPLSELERGFISLEVLSFSRERVVIQMNYQYIQPSTSFYIAVKDNEVVVFLDDKDTIYINTGLKLESFPEEIQLAIIQMLWIEDEESLYDFLETYTS